MIYSQYASQQGIDIALSAIKTPALDVLLKLDEALYRIHLQRETTYAMKSDHFRISAKIRSRKQP